MQQQIVTLSNGLKTLLIDAPGNTMGSIQTWFKAGSALENKDNEGIAHFLEHMFFKGTEKRPGFRIAHDVESFGGEINAFTSFDYTCYYINCPQSKITDSIDILMDMVSNPTFKEEDITPEIGVVYEEYRRSQDSASQYSFQKIQKHAFSGSYAHPILGSEKSIKSFNRKQLTTFRNQFYNTSNFLLVVSGDLKQRDEIIKRIEKYKLPVGPSSKFPKFKLKNKSSVNVHKKDVSMTQISIAIQAPNIMDSIAPSEDLAMATLGQGETSTLYQELVMKKTLVSSASSSTLFFDDGGLHIIRLAFPTENLKAVISEFLKVMKEVLKNGITQGNLERIKNQYVASKIYEKESLESYAFSLGHGLIQHDDIDAEDKFINNVKQVTLQKVKDSLNSILSRNLHISAQTELNGDVKSIKTECQEIINQFIKLSSKTKIKKNQDYNITKSLHDPQLRTIELKKGIHLIYRHNPISPSFVFHSYLKGGLKVENSKTNGIHHLISSLTTKGYKGTSYEKLKGDIENKAASLHGFTGKNAYGFTLHGQADHLKPLLKHFFGSMLTPMIQAKFLKHEKELTLRSLQHQLKDPTKQCFTRMSEVMFPKHTYSLNLMGTQKSLSLINKEQVLKTHLSNIQKNELVFTYCGSHSLDEILTLIEPHLKNLKSRKETKPAKFSTKTYSHKEHIEFDREQTQILIAIPTPELGHKDNSYLKILTTHLSGQSSELFVDVRDRQGLCYTAQPIHFTALEAGYWGIYMASGYDKVEAAKEALYKLLNKVQAKGLTKEEFTRVKTMIEGQEQLSVQTNDDYAGLYSIPFLHGFGTDYYYKSNKTIRTMNYEVFQKNIKRILNKDWNEILVGRV